MHKLPEIQGRWPKRSSLFSAILCKVLHLKSRLRLQFKFSKLLGLESLSQINLLGLEVWKLSLYKYLFMFLIPLLYFLSTGYVYADTYLSKTNNVDTFHCVSEFVSQLSPRTWLHLVIIVLLIIMLIPLIKIVHFDKD